MKLHLQQLSILCLLAGMALGAIGCKASASVGNTTTIATTENDAPISNLALTLDKTAKTPTDTIAPDTADFWVTFDVGDTSKGGKIEGILICDKSDAAPPNTKVVETSMDVKPGMDGDFDFSKPTKGWPVGDYHVEVYYNDKKVQERTVQGRQVATPPQSGVGHTSGHHAEVWPFVSGYATAIGTWQRLVVVLASSSLKSDAWMFRSAVHASYAGTAQCDRK